MKWEKEWKYFGTGEEINLHSLKELIDKHLDEPEILFIDGRTNSEQFKRDEIIETIKPYLGKKDFQLWTQTMDQVIRFSKIGVLHLGSKK